MSGGEPISGSGLSIDEELERRCCKEGRGNFNHVGIGRYAHNNHSGRKYRRKRLAA